MITLTQTLCQRFLKKDTSRFFGFFLLLSGEVINELCRSLERELDHQQEVFRVCAYRRLKTPVPPENRFPGGFG